jgi:glycosyltransferase involved in cell wall biosynthesis
MQIKDLIKDTEWRPGGNSSDCHPEVSVLLPVEAGDHNNLLHKSVNSILSQTLKNLELIVIDDGSTKETKEQIDALMQNDGRVSCLRHRHPIGLPAISEYEGFVKSRGKYLAFSSSNTVWESTGIDALHKHLISNKSAFVYGRVHTLSPDLLTGKLIKSQLGTSLRPQSAIRLNNQISHCAVLLKKELLDQVGLADPTPFMTQDCHWDLWIRIAEYYDLQFIDKHIATLQNLAIR